MRLSQRVQRLSPSQTLTIFDQARRMQAAGVDVVSFAAGEPDFPTPEPVKQEAIHWIRRDFTRYVSPGGIPELKQAVCEKLLRENGLAYAPEQILVGNGAKQLIYGACGALVDEGDEVIIPTPCWVSYMEQIKLFGGKPVPVPTLESDRFRLRASQVRQAVTENTRAIILNSPNNPSGAIIPAEELEKIAALAVERDICIISDEVYEKLAYTNCARPSIAALNPAVKARTVTVNSLSKSYCMTGWRVGYCAACPEIIRAMTALHGHVTGNVSSFSQKAAALALRDFADFGPMVEAYKTRGTYLVDRLNAMPGVRCLFPDGAFYAFPNVTGLFGANVGNKTLESAVDVSAYLLEKARIACVPGEAFGREGYVRFTFAIDFDSIQKGMDRMEAALKALF